MARLSQKHMTEKHTFESAFARLEEIVEKMHHESITLDESLKLYEEGDALIQLCGKKLQEAETKIEMLIKNREGDLSLDENKKPHVKEFER
jgi:exodeoxyribonuclease VII small subunit